MNDMIDISENEWRLLQAVEFGDAASQRKLAGHLDISLGMVNLCIRRLMKKGLLKTRGLNGRKLKYILTPKGFTPLENAADSCRRYKLSFDGGVMPPSLIVREFGKNSLTGFTPSSRQARLTLSPIAV